MRWASANSICSGLAWRSNWVDAWAGKGRKDMAGSLGVTESEW